MSGVADSVPRSRVPLVSYHPNDLSRPTRKDPAMRASLVLTTLAISSGLMLSAPAAVATTTLTPVPPTVVEQPPTDQSVVPLVTTAPVVVPPVETGGPPLETADPPTGTVESPPVETTPETDPEPGPETSAPVQTTPEATTPPSGPSAPTGEVPGSAPTADGSARAPARGVVPEEALEAGVGVPAQRALPRIADPAPAAGGRSVVRTPDTPASTAATRTSSGAAVVQPDEPVQADEAAGTLQAGVASSFRNTAAGILSVVALLLAVAVAVVAQPRRRRTH